MKQVLFRNAKDDGSTINDENCLLACHRGWLGFDSEAKLFPVEEAGESFSGMAKVEVGPKPINTVLSHCHNPPSALLAASTLNHRGGGTRHVKTLI